MLQKDKREQDNTLPQCYGYLQGVCILLFISGLFLYVCVSYKIVMLGRDVFHIK